jgi:hypothetical protein
VVPVPVLSAVPLIVTFCVAGAAPLTVSPVRFVCAPAQVLVLSLSKERVPAVAPPVMHKVLRTPAAGSVGVVTDWALVSVMTN